MILPPHCRVLACKVLYHELRLLGVPDSQALYLDQGLHRHPDDLSRQVALALAQLEQDPAVETVVLGYGYCGGGLEGLRGRRARLVAPKAHDCIPLLLGRHLPPGAGVDQGGTFYLSPGWVDFGQTPYSEYYRSLPLLGQEDALWCCQQMLKAYTEVALIRHEPLFREHQRRMGLDMAGLFGLAYREIPGDLGWLQRLLACRPSHDVLAAPPGQALRQEMFNTG
ncbi:MAG: DUF1638 domain-containing protein [Desulfarculus sp.]|nr:DUF1638 domain-containing protein [Desulfarculus sp.]